MAKFGGPSVIPGAQPELPTGPQPGGEFAEFFNQPQQEETTPATSTTKSFERVAQEASQELTEAPFGELSEQEQEQREIERVAPISELPQVAEKTPTGSLIDYQRETDDPFSVALERGDKVNNVLQGTGDVRLQAKPTAKILEGLKAGDPEAAFNTGATPELKSVKGSETSISARNIIYDPRVLDAGTINPTTGLLSIDPEFGTVMSLATENWLYNQTNIAEETTKEPGDFEPEGQQVETPTVVEVVKSAKHNEQLGREVYRSWKRQKAAREGKPTDAYLNEEGNINRETFSFIGDLAKETYAEANPDILYRPPQAEDSPQIYFQLTNKGVDALNAVERDVKGLFGVPEVAPLNAVSETAQPQFEAKTRVRKVTTKVGELGDTSQINESMKNYHSVKFVNDPQREKIVMQFGILGMLNANKDNVYADMFDIGRDNLLKTHGKRDKMISDATREGNADELAKAQAYDVNDIIRKNFAKFMNIMGGIAQYSDRSNHLTYSMQALTGRTHVQQTRYNPQAHKVVRTVVGGGNVLTWRPGEGIIDRNFKEIMAAFFIKEAKNVDTNQRIEMFDKLLKDGNLKEFIDAGNEIKNAINGFDIKGALADMSQASNLNGESAVEFRKVLAQKYNNDPLSQSTKNILRNFGDEGAHMADALIHLADYDNAVKNNIPMKGTLTVEMDGKTHGPATNAAILGVEQMAKRTGLLRPDDMSFEESQDSRVAMGEWIKNVGITLTPEGKYKDALIQIANLAVNDKANYLKKSPMTMGYGQELDSLKMHVETTIYNGDPKVFPQIQAIMKDSGLDQEPQIVVEYLHGLLVDSIFEINSSKVVAMSKLLRANNLLATMTDEVLYMDNASGFRSYAAAKQVIPEKTKEIKYGFEKEGKTATRKAQIYEYEKAGSAVRQYQKGEEPVPGGFGHGRVVPIAVQSYDGNMISKTGSGQSWDRIKDRSKARKADNPFVLPIFDAFVTDLASFDTVREESNRNWVKGLREHSYVESIMDTWYKETMSKVRNDFKNKDPKALVDINDDTKWRGINWLFNKYTKGMNPKPNIQYMLSKVIKVRPKKPGESITDYRKYIGQEAGAVKTKIYKEMKSAGIPQNFDQLTNKQLQDLIEIVMKNINLSSRNSSAINTIKKDKAELFRKFDTIGKVARQVDIA